MRGVKSGESFLLFSLFFFRETANRQLGEMLDERGGTQNQKLLDVWSGKRTAHCSERNHFYFLRLAFPNNLFRKRKKTKTRLTYFLGGARKVRKHG